MALREGPRPAAGHADRGWLSTLRVRDFGHFLLLPLAGVDPSLGALTSAAALIRGVAIAFCLLAFGYLINSLSDRDMDAVAAKNPFIARAPKKLLVGGALGAFALLSVVLATSGPAPVVAATVVCLASGVVYSVGPRLKRLPIVGTFLNVTNFAPLLWVGLADGAAAPSMGSITIAFSALLLQNQILHEAADRAEDARGRIATTYRALGAGRSALLGVLFGGVLVATCAWSAGVSALAIPASLVFVAYFPYELLRRGDDTRAMRRARLHHRYASVVAGAAIFIGLRFFA